MPPPKTRDLGKRSGRSRAQTGKQNRVKTGQVGGRAPAFAFRAEKRETPGGEVRGQRVDSLPQKKPAQSGCGGETACRERFVVIARAHAADGVRGNVAVLPERAEIGKREQVVRRGRRVGHDFPQAVDVGERRAVPRTRFLAVGGEKRGGGGDVRRRAQKVKVTALRAEPEVGYAEPREQGDPRRAERFAVRRAMGKGQLKHRVRTARKEHLRPHARGEDRRFSALGEATAHHKDHRVSAVGTGTIHQIQMPRMGRIAFADNARDSHSSSFPCVLSFIIPVFCLFVNHFGDFGGQKAEKVRKNS